MKRALAGLLALGLGLVTSAHAGTDDSIYDIQQGLIAPNTAVSVQGVVVTGVFFNWFYAQEPDQQAGSYAYGGITCFYGATPNVQVGDVVDVTGAYSEYFFESEINMTVSGGFTVVGSASVPDPVALNITDVNNDGVYPPEPPGGFANGEEWEGVLVRVEQPDMVSTATLRAGCASSSPTRWGVYQTSAPAESLFVRNSVASHETPLPASPITFIQGIMSYYQCNRNIVPRDNDDVGYTGPPNVVWAFSKPANLAGGNTTKVDVVFSRDVTAATSEDLGNYFFLSGLTISAASRDALDPSVVHLTTQTQPDAVQDELFVQSITSEGGATMPSAQSVQFYTGLTTIEDIQFVVDPGTSDASPFLNGVVSTIGTATTSTTDTGTGDFSIGVQPSAARGTGGYTGLRVGLGGIGAAIGDRIRVSGTVIESFGRTTIDFIGFGTYVKLGVDPEIPPISFASPSDLPYNNVAESEPWEDVLVTVEEAVVDTVPQFWVNGEWWLLPVGASAAPGDSAKTDYIAGGVASDFGWEPCVGNTVLMTGIYEYSFGEYKIIPRRNGDVGQLGFGPGCLVATGEVSAPFVAQTRNFPNPFNPTTTIEFTTPDEGVVTLEIFDTMGRRVRTVVGAERFAPGTHAVRWDGRNDAGQSVASGSYFYRVVLEGRSLTDRMTLLK